LKQAIQVEDCCGDQAAPATIFQIVTPKRGKNKWRNPMNMAD
jgi:hypothetical protein